MMVDGAGDWEKAYVCWWSGVCLSVALRGGGGRGCDFAGDGAGDEGALRVALVVACVLRV